MNESSRWGLPLLAAGQAQKEITHNEAMLAVDRLLQLAVASRRAVEPPAESVPGDLHIVGFAAVGPWADHVGELAAFDGRGWTYTVPRPGCLAWVIDEQEFTVFAADGWSEGGWSASGFRIGGRSVLATAPIHVNAPLGGTTVDVECRSTLAALLGALRGQGVIY